MTRRTRALGTLASLCLLALAGCAVDQDQEVAFYRSVVDLEAPPLVEGEPVSLRHAMLLANRANENLSIEGEAFLRSLIARRRAAANFMPSVDLIASYVRRDETGGGAGGGGGGARGDESFQLAGDLNWALFQGFRNVNAYWRDTWIIEERRNNLLSLQEALLLDVSFAYYQVLRAEELVRVLENSLGVQEARLRDTRGRLEAGVARSLDVAQTQAQVSSTRTTLTNARRDVNNARSLLALLSASPIREASLSDGYEAPATIEPVDAYLAAAAAFRHELAAANAAIEAARRDVEVAWGQYYPTVSLNFNALLFANPSDAVDWDNLLLASVPIFSGGRIHADVRAAWSFFREARLVESYLRRQVEQEVRQAHEDYAASLERLVDLRVQLDAADQAFRQSEAAYRAGLATNLDRIAAQDVLLEAQLLLASEAYDQKVLYLTLLRAGGLLREELETGEATLLGPPAVAGPDARVVPAAGADVH